MHLDDPKTRARFEAKVDRSGECHLWTAAHIPSGHGVFWLPKPVGKLVYAHRVALEYRLGRPLADGELATHACDTPACVHPGHLEPGDYKKNAGDAVSRSRHAHGSRHYLTNLTDQDVREIIALLTTPGAKQEDIATRYGVSRSAIAQIKRGRSWKHIARPDGPWPGRSDTHRDAKLTSAAVQEIVQLLATGARNIDLAARYGVSGATIANIKAGRIWKGITRPLG